MSIKRNINCIDSFSICRESSSSSSSDEADLVERISLIDDSQFQLKKDHNLRPIYVCSDRKVILEAFSPVAQYAQDFLITISEPISRPQWIHEYRITEFSLYAAISVGLNTRSILSVLDRLSKCEIPFCVKEFITEKTESFGKLKLILKNNEYWIESHYELILKQILKDAVIAESRVLGNSDDITVENIQNILLDSNNLFSGQVDVKKDNDNHALHPELENIDLFDLFNDEMLSDDPISIDIVQDIPAQATQSPISHTPNLPQNPIIKPNQQSSTIQLKGDPFGDVITLDMDDDKEEESSELIYSFQIKKTNVSHVRKRCSELNYPLSEEYHFRGDIVNVKLDVDLKPTTKLRGYQKEGLSKMFSSGRARSGIIVLPCGAGKTLVGVTAACTIKKSCLVLCTSSVSVDQWAREFKHWSTLSETQIGKFTADSKDRFTGECGVLVSTYSMATYSGKRAYDAQKMMEFIQSREWGLLILDEVHVVPADMFKKVFTIITSHAKLGLTATLVREDDKIHDLNYLLGPKLYEANWLDLANLGHIAKVQCAQVWCHMTREFYGEYLREKSRKRQLLYVMNPSKIQACQYLIEYHEALGDKTIVFSDNVFALKHYASTFNRPFIYGGSSPAERSRILHQFRYNPALNTIFLSKVGDTSIDIPEASCLIQISSHYGSRRQEAQRLGRILRAKRKSTSGFNAFFYTLVSRDTEEMLYATKRQQFLVDQGYAFKVITKLQGLENNRNLVYREKSKQIDLLNTVLLSSETDYAKLNLDSDEYDSSQEQEEELQVSRRGTTSLSALSGGDSMAYLEYKRVHFQRRRKS